NSRTPQRGFSSAQGTRGGPRPQGDTRTAHAAAQDEFENTPRGFSSAQGTRVVPGHRSTPGQLHAAAQM
ncbi:Phosphatidylserine Synthase 2, partial [Manis pentadactyla]